MSEGEELRDLVERSWAEDMDDSPEAATFYGWPGRHTRWMDRRPEAFAARHGRLHERLAALDAIDRRRLSSEDAVTHDLFRWELADRIEAVAFHDELQPLNQLEGPQQDPAMVISAMPAETTEDRDAIVERLTTLDAVIDQSIELMRQGMGAGIVPPAVCLRDVPDQVANQLVSDPSDSPLLAPLRGAGEHVEDAAAEIYRTRIAPAYERLDRFLRETYVASGRADISCRALPGGDERYAFAVRHYTTTNLSAQEVHDIGKDEVARIGAEMRKVIAEVGFDGTFEDFARFLATDDRFFFTKGQDLVDAYRAIAARIDPELPRLFGRQPKLAYAIEPVPSYAEKSQTAAYYLPGAPDGSRPGTFFANTYDLRSRPAWEMESLTLHEAVPGHHLQIALAQEQHDLPAFRRNAWFTAHGEGWGLYAESLGGELGLYTDRYQRYGAYFGEMWRAIRLVVDTGMHALGWSREQAIAYAEEQSGRTDHDVVVEIDRYIVWPGQALAYKIGELELQRLRRSMTDRLGVQFDVRDFHDEVLRHGSVPLDLLARLVDEWSESILSA
ncbi:MAG: hypothetical protein QOJ09_1234 [Actinomycetota bacterium]|nr:hypothetical protein [Actinomycetota bacterium]